MLEQAPPLCHRPASQGITSFEKSRKLCDK